MVPSSGGVGAIGCSWYRAVSTRRPLSPREDLVEVRNVVAVVFSARKTGGDRPPRGRTTVYSPCVRTRSCSRFLWCVVGDALVVCVGGRKGEAGDSLCGKGVFWERLRWRWLEVLWSRLVGRHLFGGYFGTAFIWTNQAPRSCHYALAFLRPAHVCWRLALLVKPRTPLLPVLSLSGYGLCTCQL